MKRQHPLSSFLFCPRCGEAGLEHVNERAIHCTHCDLTYFHNVASSVACFVLDKDGQILTVRRGREPAKGTLDLPGGFVDPECRGGCPQRAARGNWSKGAKYALRLLDTEYLSLLWH